MSCKIFLNYRRSDATDVAQKLEVILKKKFGPAAVFLDSEKVNPGDKPSAVLLNNLATCIVMVVIVGPHWIHAKDEQTGAPRLDDPEDWVRREITHALDREIFIVPVLVDATPKPRRDQLPEKLRRLLDTEPARIVDAKLPESAQQLIDVVKKAVERAGPPRPPWPIRTLTILFFVASLVVVFGARNWPEISDVLKKLRGGETSKRLEGGADAGGTRDVVTVRPKIGKRKAPTSGSAADKALQEANAGNIEAMFLLARFYETGDDDLEVDDREAARWYRTAADKGHGAAMRQLADMYLKGRVSGRVDDANAIQWLLKAEQAGNLSALNDLGFMYQRGRGTDAKLSEQARFSEAMKWYKRAADRNNATGMYNIAWMYENGQGVTAPEPAQALEWYKRAAVRGEDVGNLNIVALANFKIGELYEKGRGAVKAVKLAEYFYRKSAVAMHPGAMYKLGRIYAIGDGVARSPAEAANWYFDAFSKGSALLVPELKLVDKGKRDIPGLPTDVRHELLALLKAQNVYAGTESDNIGPEVIAAIEELVAKAKRKQLVSARCLECH